ncbi:MAG: flagellar M-ring protein FliF [Halanaerobiaceae bacterium]|jgi:flagellar M-ring protein FliF|nr:flagellar M-ring protein FliF [Halanaerobiaceae bacterium]
MFDWIKPYSEQFNDFWSKLNKRARIVIITIVLTLVIGLISIIIWSSSSPYQILFNNLAPVDANSIIQKLEEEGISYRLADNGRTILVPAEYVYKTRLLMAGEGLPTQGVVGFEIFDQSSFGTTDFERKVNFYRALSGELSRTIQTMNNVEFARVQISAPEESIFIEEDKPAQASVLLKIKPGRTLSAGQVQAISNLVASSVQGLKTENVTIVDTTGNLLTPVFQEEALLNSQLAMKQFEIERQFAEGLKQDLRILLTRVLGSNNFTLQVNARLNFDQRQVESKEYYPVIDEEGIIRSQQEYLESYQGVNPGSGGVPGTSSNIPQYQLVENELYGQYENTERITNYEINEKIERHIYAPGKVEHISVAVVVNDLIDETTLDKIEEIVKASIGYDSMRGDIVAITSLAFDRSLEEEYARLESAAYQAERTRMYLYSGLIIFVLLTLVILTISLKRSVQTASEEIIPGKAVDFIIGDEEEMSSITEELTEEERQRIQLRDAIAKAVSEQPAEVAQLLKSWLLDE